MAHSCEDIRNDCPAESDTNPFLFSNFLKKDTIDKRTAQVWKNFDSSNESLDNAPFPDLCIQQKSVCVDKKVKQQKKSIKLKDSNPDVDSKKRILKIVDDAIQVIDEDEVGRLLEDEHNAEVPDERRKSSAENTGYTDEHSSDSDDSFAFESSYILPSSCGNKSFEHNSDSKIEELTEENKLLRQNVRELEQDLEKERATCKKRIDNLMDELRAARKKELEETATLENVVQMVEENLRQTTQRALKAEASVSKMKDEIKFLREETILKSKHEQIVEEYEFRLESIRQKSKDAAKLMHTAANKTEPLLKELLAGVSSLHVYADQFENIDKIADTNPTRDRVV